MELVPDVSCVTPYDYEIIHVFLQLLHFLSALTLSKYCMPVRHFLVCTLQLLQQGLEDRI